MQQRRLNNGVAPTPGRQTVWNNTHHPNQLPSNNVNFSFQEAFCSVASKQVLNHCRYCFPHDGCNQLMPLSSHVCCRVVRRRDGPHVKCTKIDSSNDVCMSSRKKLARARNARKYTTSRTDTHKTSSRTSEATLSSAFVDSRNMCSSTISVFAARTMVDKIL